MRVVGKEGGENGWGGDVRRGVMWRSCCGGKGGRAGGVG